MRMDEQLYCNICQEWDGNCKCLDVSESSLTDLLPCPFCGTKATGPEHGDSDWWIECAACEIVMDDQSKQELISRWNGRI